MTDNDMLNAVIEISKIFISADPNKYYNDSEMLEDLLKSISQSITEVESKGYFNSKSK